MTELEELEAQRVELTARIQRLREEEERRPTRLLVAGVHLHLFPKERYAGSILDDAGNIIYHLVVMAARPNKHLSWSEADAWAVSIGGGLPSLRECSLIHANCSQHLRPVLYWTSERWTGDVSEVNSQKAECMNIRNGSQSVLNTGSNYLAAIAVRRVYTVGEAA